MLVIPATRSGNTGVMTDGAADRWKPEVRMKGLVEMATAERRMLICQAMPMILTHAIGGVCSRWQDWYAGEMNISQESERER